MPSYYVNQSTQPNGLHDVHRAGCDSIPMPRKRLYLGEFTNSEEALREARRHYAQVEVCERCASETGAQSLGGEADGVPWYQHS